ncbi:MAG: hypothetical protein HY908_13120 [Myxococcales bacterium]|nr:hypothetical protein [Myxococcales bacterium]
MSEYQCYEFVALDRPLTAKQMGELRAISTRAEISPTRFWNEYQWGDLKADPARLMARYFDAHLYFANWGTHRIMLRMPTARVDLKALEPYFVGRNAARLTTVGENVLLDLGSDTEEPEYDEQSPGSLAALSPLRAELMRGDLRPAYLAWLLAVAADDVDDDAEEPPVPPGLGELTAAQEAVVDFLRIDVDLVAAGASGSAAATEDGAPFRRWLAALPVKDKDAWLRRAADEPDLALGGELLRAFRATTKGQCSGARRTVGELRALAETQRTEREKAEAARAKKARAAAEAARQRHLTKLAHDVDGAWAKLEKLVEGSSYDEAVKLAVDLRELTTRDGAGAGFEKRFEAMRRRQVRRRGFFDRWKRATKADS